MMNTDLNCKTIPEALFAPRVLLKTKRSFLH